MPKQIVYLGRAWLIRQMYHYVIACLRRAHKIIYGHLPVSKGIVNTARTLLSYTSMQAGNLSMN